MDVKEILVSKNIPYSSKGRDYLIKCVNPEHDDSNPSLRIDKISGLMHCFSCGYANDIYKYFNIHKEKFIDIKVKQLMEKINKLKTIHNLSIPLDAVHFKDDWRYIKGKTLLEFGAFTTESIKKMDGRIVFPIWNILGDIVAFQGRYLYSDLEPRYDIYPENVPLPLYPAVVRPIKGSIILVEGILDMINLHDKGLHNAVCTFGTAFGSVKNNSKKKNNIERLLQYKYQGIDTIYIMYDADTAGKDAANNLYNYINKTFITDIIELEDGRDPGSLKQSEVNKLIGEYYG
jgi:DNA primase